MTFVRLFASLLIFGFARAVVIAAPVESRHQYDGILPSVPAQAERLYMQYCSVCHGENGDGNSHVRQGMRPRPRDFTSTESAAILTADRIAQAIRDGRPGTAMVGWKDQLDDRQIDAITTFIRDRFMVHDPHAEADRGYAIYSKTCSVCHGEDGAGAVWGKTSLNPPPVDFTSRAARIRLTRERMIESVSHGRPGTAMAAFTSQLNEEEIVIVVDYIRDAYMSTPAPPAVDVHTQSSDQNAGYSSATAKPDAAEDDVAGLAGDPIVGRALYGQNCIACHGINGDGAGPRAYFIFPKPRNFLNPQTRQRLDRAALFRAIKNGVAGREMPAWGKVLGDQAIADITEYVLNTFFHRDLNAME